MHVGKQNPIARNCSTGDQRAKQPRGRGGHRNTVHWIASRYARTRAIVVGRGSRPFLKSNTKRGSPTASRPNRVGATSLWRRNFSTSLNKCTVQSLLVLTT